MTSLQKILKEQEEKTTLRNQSFLGRRQFWYIMTSPSVEEIGLALRDPRKYVKYFPFMQYNARINQGEILSAGSFFDGITPRISNPEAESHLEEKRSAHLPSRKKCYFLNTSEEAAVERWERVLITPCYLVGEGNDHCADERLYEKIAHHFLSQTKITEDIQESCYKYWQHFDENHLHCEFLTNRGLYFPEWQAFSNPLYQLSLYAP